MIVPFVDLKIQYQSIKREIDSAIGEVFQSGTFVGGESVRKFEAEFAKEYGVKHVIGVNSGTDALYIILKALGMKEGDEVITTALSWISTAEAISWTGATPVFVDIDSQTYTINPDLIESKISSRTKAILPVHLYGQMAHMQRLRDLCRKHNLYLIEDCAQSHFSDEGGTYAGNFGIASAFSFYPSKSLGAYGDAGCIVTNEDDVAVRCRRFANHGALIKHDHAFEGVNSKLDSIQAAILSVKLRHVKKWNKMRIALANQYRALLEKDTEIFLPTVRANTTHTFHLFVIRTKKRDALKRYLESRGVQCSIHYPVALPNLSIYHDGRTSSEFPIATKFQREILSLPMYPELTAEQVAFVCEQILTFNANQ
jgi:dTDP-4-amino-4,6-dideoxygalactose transaminase